MFNSTQHAYFFLKKAWKGDEAVYQGQIYIKVPWTTWDMDGERGEAMKYLQDHGRVQILAGTRTAYLVRK